MFDLQNEGNKRQGHQIGVSALLFLIPIFTYQRRRESICEYDTYFLIIFSAIVALLTCIKCASSDSKSTFKIDGIKISGLSICILISTQFYALSGIEWHHVSIAWCLLFLYCLLTARRLDHPCFLLAYSAICLIVLSLNILNIDIFSFGSDPYKRSANAGENANYLASTIPFLIAVTITLWRRYCDIKRRVIVSFIPLASSILGLTLILKSGSRTAAVAVSVSLLVFASSPFSTDILLRLWIRTKLKLSVLLLLLIPVIVGTYRLIIINVDSVIGRILIYRVSIRLIFKNFTYGIGIQRFGHLYNNEQSIFLSESNFSPDIQNLANDTFFCFNEFYQIIIELGLIGCIAVCFIVVKLLYHFLRIKSKTALEYGAFASLLSIFICCQSSYPLHNISILVNVIFFSAIVIKKKSNNSVDTIMKLNKRYLLYCICLYLIFSLLSVVKETERIRSHIIWKHAMTESLSGNFKQADLKYRKLLPLLKSNGNFIFNYGSEAFVAGEYGKSNKLLTSASHLVSHSNLYIYFGNSYYQLLDFRNAISCYKFAMNMVPAKFLPKYLLFLTYQRIGNKKEATRMAHIIYNWPVKVPSREVELFKKQAKMYLSKKRE